ncbi:MAG: hypothetical protein JW854_05150 [Actinobacteria bacterium]|nr:hypothetical protein [Actinomycetota bacterium]
MSLNWSSLDRVERTVPFMFSMDEIMNVGRESGTPVTDDYDRAGSDFNGTVDWVRIDLGLDSHDHFIDPEHLLTIAMTRQWPATLRRVRGVAPECCPLQLNQ